MLPRLAWQLVCGARATQRSVYKHKYELCFGAGALIRFGMVSVILFLFPKEGAQAGLGRKPLKGFRKQKMQKRVFCNLSENLLRAIHLQKTQHMYIIFFVFSRAI